MNLKKKGNRRGATTLFLAIILSAIILVECTYIELVEDLRCNLAYTRGVKLQVETFLSDYDRQLLKTYGIYAFNMDTIDSDVFRMTLEGSGIEAGSDIYVCGVNSFDTDDLRDAVSLYYAYRSSGVIFDYLSDYIFEALEEIDQFGLIDKFRGFVRSEASDVLMDIIDGASTISDEISEYASELGIEDLAEYMDEFSEFIDMFDQLDNDSPDVGGGFSPRDMDFGIDAVSSLYDVMDSTADMISGPLFHGFAVNYACYNFDCKLEDDTALDGTEFTEFHEGSISDTEYILTGLEDSAGEIATGFLIFQIIYVMDIIRVILDPGKMSWIDGIASVLAILIDVLTAGAVIVTPEVCKVVIVIFVAEFMAVTDLISVLQGEKITLVELEGIPAINVGYRELISMYMNIVPDSILLTRMNNVLRRDFAGYVCGICAGTTCNGVEITYSRTYDIYENEIYE